MGKLDYSEKDSIYEEDDRSRTPIINGPIIELRGREVVFAIGVFFLTAIVVGLVVVLASNKVKDAALDSTTKTGDKETSDIVDGLKAQLDSERTRYCVSLECVRFASRLVGNMDLNVSPCNDFWKYSCGGWLQRYTDGYSVSDLVADKIAQQMRSLLPPQGKAMESSSEAFQTKVFTLYDSCMNDVDGEDTDDAVDLLNGILDEFGGWSALDDWNLGEKSGRWHTQKALQTLQFDYDVETLFSVEVVQTNDKYNVLNNVTREKETVIKIGKLSQSSLNLPDHSYYKRSESDPVIVAYKQYMSTVASLYNVTTNKTEEFVHNTYNLEKRLAQLHESDEKRTDSEALVTVEELQKISPRIKWLPFLKHGFRNVTEKTRVLLTNAAYLSNVSALIDIETTDETYLNAYFVWRLMSRLAVPLLPSPFRQAHETYKRTLYETYDRHQFCQGVLEKFFSKALSAMYMKKYMSNSTLIEVNEMIESITHEFQLTLCRCHWMDTPTRKAAELKLKNMTFVVGGEAFLFEQERVDQYYINYTVNSNISLFENILNGQKFLREMKTVSSELNFEKENWMANSYTADVAYYPRRNAIGITAGILQDPYFDDKAPVMLNYGFLGTLIAHEMTHAFDEEGAAYDEFGLPLEKDWWSDDTWDKFHREIYCMQEAYKEFKVNCLAANCRKTAEENIADVGGLRLAYKAFNHWSKSNKVHQLPIGNMSNNQVFFVAYAQSLCKHRDPSSLMKFLEKSSKSPEPIRVRGSVLQLNVSAEVFQCPKDKRKDAITRCLIW